MMSTIAVFLLLGGGAAFAATKLGKNSVGTKQIRNQAVTAAKVKNGAITGTQVRGLDRTQSKFDDGCGALGY